MEQDDLETVARLMAQRWAALASTNADGSALASQVAVAWVPGTAHVLMHLSTLAKHTRNIMERPRASLAISEPDDGRDDPQTLARVSLTGDITIIERGSADHGEAAKSYLAHLPMAAPRFDFGDFNLFRLTVDSAQYVGGFARAMRISAEKLAQMAPSRAMDS